MSSPFPTPPSHRLFRGTVLVFAMILACQAIWLVTPELLRLRSLNLSDARVTVSRDSAVSAASFALIRGDLWADAALTHSDIRLGDERTGAQSIQVIKRAREVADRALGLAPYDARIWLLLARIDARFDWLNRKSSDELRMSYYLGPNETELISSRLPLAINSSDIGDQDFQQLVGHDVRIILTRKPELIPAILAAYQDASPNGKQFLETTLKELDPTLLAKLHSKG